jgi:hypothetical protein
MATPLPPPKWKVNPSREEVWSENFRRVKEFYDEHRHLTLPRTDPESLRLTQWLTYQRHRNKALRKDQLERLESIKYNTVPIQRKDHEHEWNVKYNRLKKLHDCTDHVKKVKDRDLVCWVARQRSLLKSNLLDPTRQEMLKKIGIDVLTTKCSSCRKIDKTQQFDKKWQSQFEKLKEYHRIHGNCNVPARWKMDKTLGLWVYNQRRNFIQLKTGVADMDPDRIQKLEQLGFEWSRRTIRSAASCLSATKSNN